MSPKRQITMLRKKGILRKIETMDERERIEVSTTDLQRDLARIQDHVTAGGEAVVLRYGKPIMLLTPYQEDIVTTTATTDYGSWHNLMGGTTLTITDDVREALDDESDYDVDAIVHEYRAEINKVLPHGVTIHGEGDQYGPHPRPSWWMDADADEWQELRAEIEAISLWDIIARHERQTTQSALSEIRAWARIYKAEATQLKEVEQVGAWMQDRDRRPEPHVAAQWANAGYTPGEAFPLIAAGFTPETAPPR